MLKGLIVLAIDEGLYSHLFAYSPGQLPLTRLDGGAWDDITPPCTPLAPGWPLPPTGTATGTCTGWT